MKFLIIFELNFYKNYLVIILIKLLTIKMISVIIIIEIKKGTNKMIEYIVYNIVIVMFIVSLPSMLERADKYITNKKKEEKAL